MLDNKKQCRYFTGRAFDREEGKARCCAAGRRYYDVMRVAELGGFGAGLRLPCHGHTGIRQGQPVTPCDSYAPLTREELAAQQAAVDQSIGRVQSGLSPCCGAALDTSRVISAGPHEGHGPRYCTECNKLAFRV